MKPTLLVLAAGMGSRFGGLKQMAPVGPSDEWILDYSVHDAIRAGFGRVVFVIREEMETEFKKVTSAKYGRQIELRYAIQKLEDTPVTLPSYAHREKPWGTGHAVYAARKQLDAPFAVINADDFYGADAFATLSNFLTDDSLQAKEETYGLVGYGLSNTLSDHGSVSRGVCQTDPDGELLAIEEHTNIRLDENGRIHGTDSNGVETRLAGETTVSLNCWGFPKGWADRIEPLFAQFLDTQGREAKSEFYLPAAVDTLIGMDEARALALPCNARWLGITHREDLPKIREAIAELVSKGDYATPIFEASCSIS